MQPLSESDCSIFCPLSYVFRPLSPLSDRIAEIFPCHYDALRLVLATRQQALQIPRNHIYFDIYPATRLAAMQIGGS